MPLRIGGAGADRRRPHPGPGRNRHPGRARTAAELPDPAAARATQRHQPPRARRARPPPPRVCPAGRSAGGAAPSACWRSTRAPTRRLIGELFYVARALGPTAELRSGQPRHAAVPRPSRCIVLADVPLEGEEARTLDQMGGERRPAATLRRAAHGGREGRGPVPSRPPLLPVKLLAGDRQLGGALVLEPAAEAGTVRRRPPRSPGWPCRTRCSVTRQVLAEPSAQTRRAHLGGPGRRHAARDGRPPRRRPGRPVPCDRQCRLVQPAALRPVRRHAAPPGGPLGRRRRRRRRHGAGPGRNAWTASAHSSHRRPPRPASRPQNWRQPRRRKGGVSPRHPARPVWAGKRPPRAQPGRAACRNWPPPRRHPGRCSPPCKARCGSVRSARLLLTVARWPAGSRPAALAPGCAACSAAPPSQKQAPRPLVALLLLAAPAHAEEPCRP